MSNTEVGDRIYFHKYGHLDSYETVIKVTDAQIKTKYHTIRKSDLLVLGQGQWKSTSASLETQELNEEWRKLKLREWLSKNWQDIPDELIEYLKSKMEK